MKIAKYELKVVHKKKLILTMEDDVDSEELLKIFLETQLKEEKEQNELLGIIAEKVSEEGCTEQCESCQKYCPASEECMATDENVRCTRQRFCNTDCTKAHQQAEKEKKRFAEKGEHTFRQKVCKICGKPFWPSNGQEVLCSEECKTINRRQKQLAYYHRKQSEQKAGEAI